MFRNSFRNIADKIYTIFAAALLIDISIYMKFRNRKPIVNLVLPFWRAFVQIKREIKNERIENIHRKCNVPCKRKHAIIQPAARERKREKERDRVVEPVIKVQLKLLPTSWVNFENKKWTINGEDHSSLCVLKTQSDVHVK